MGRLGYERILKMNMIEMNNVSFSYDEKRPIIQRLSFTIKEGESVGLIGANGAGKSTVLKLLLGLIKGEGEIRIAGISVEKSHLSEIRKKMGFVLQNSDHQMFMPTVWEDLLFGPLNYGLSREEAEEKALKALKNLGVEDLKDRYNHKLSGGEKRMGAIATVLAMEPEIILMDEPTASLDPYNRRLVIHAIKELPQTKVITSHDLDMIFEICDRVILLSNGTLVSDAAAKELLLNQTLLETNRMELPLRFQKYI